MAAETILPPDDLKVEVWPYGESKGGQHVGINSGVKVTHLPTRTVAIVESCRSQFRNREIALDMILAAVTHPRFDR
ncbi:hypothetical protein OIU35_31420 [Boseaceae bacterium BT-24-1]|nr:hypothetical protein [Boseaceae bacterium BT-24-1]